MGTLFGRATTDDMSEATQELRAKVPPHILPPLDRYISQHVPPGHFLTAVLSNDLREACCRADDVCRAAILQIVYYLHNCCPHAAWGSPEKVARWLELGRSRQ